MKDCRIASELPIEADEVGASLKWSTAKVERPASAATDRTQGREHQAERGGEFNDVPPSENLIHSISALGKPGGAGLWEQQKRIWSDLILIRHIRGLRSSWKSA